MELTDNYKLSLAYFFLICGGIMGVHRLYLKNLLAVIYVILFCAVIYANTEADNARIESSNVKSKLIVADFLLKQAEKNNQIKVIAEQSVQQSVQRDELSAWEIKRKNWLAYASWMFYIILCLMALDIFRLPRLIAKKNEEIGDTDSAITIVDKLGQQSSLTRVSNPNTFINWVEWINHWTGHYIAFWTLLAVFVFFYEVIVRYVFNSPTNWAHESMFLVFGSQYLLAGGFALKEGSHVRVDILYSSLSKKNKAWMDMVSSILFFILAFSMVITGWIFFYDAWQIQEVSFTEWAVHYWPTKLSIVLGSVLLLLQGIAHFIQNLQIVRTSNGS